MIDIYLEIGRKRVFAGATGWPGWCRSGMDETMAKQALVESGPRYQEMLRAAALEVIAPPDISGLNVVERLVGSASTDFGAPDRAPAVDAMPVEATDLQRFLALLQACWLAFDRAADAAAHKELTKGPRGGGRELEAIARHVSAAEAAYLARLGRKIKLVEGEYWRDELERTRQAILAALPAAVRGEFPEAGPRGGARWKPRYFVRRSAWHVLDHAWEIEDRIERI